MAITWRFMQYIFVENGADPIQASTVIVSPKWLMYHWTSGLTSGLNTIVADAIMIWRCWVVWGSRYEVIVLPTLLLASQSVFGWLALHSNIYGGPVKQEVTWLTLYLSLSLVTTLFCTVLIIYRIIKVGKYPGNDGTSLCGYRGIIEILVESALLYAISLIFWLAFLLGSYTVSFYPEMIYVSITVRPSFPAVAQTLMPLKGIAPTLIVGRVASGQARPNDNWKSSSVSAIQFGGRSVPQSESVPPAEGTLSNCHEAKLEDDGLERSDSCGCDGAHGSSRRASVEV
ncbi:hypothetical protein IW262DRAFT_1454755 [Armillaria fumosa]|nr:hypothetical protein IW262DRAFT_1454755 [Armillaria fumosa]